MSEVNYIKVLLLDDNENGLIPYITPATADELGVIKAGHGVCIDSDGRLHASCRNIGEDVQSNWPLVDASLHLKDGSLILAGGMYDRYVQYTKGIYEADSTIYHCWKYGSNTIWVLDYIIKANTVLYSDAAGTVYTGSAFTIVSDGGLGYKIQYNGSDCVYDPSQDTLVSYGSLFTSESDFQSSISDYGVCSRYVFTQDSSGNPVSVRLPKCSTKDRILLKAYKNGTDWYNIYSDGWCEQGGQVSASTTPASVSLYFAHRDTNFYVDSNVKGTGAYSDVAITNASTISVYATSAATVNWETKGYVSTSVYANLTRPVYDYVVIATSTKTEIESDIDHIAVDLNRKVDLDNLAPIHAVIETYQNGTSWYRIYDDGWCEQGGYSVATDPANSLTHQIAFLQTFRDTSYIFSYQGRSIATPSSVQASVWDFQYNNKTTNSILVWNSSTYQSGVDWQASGYIA